MNDNTKWHRQPAAIIDKNSRAQAAGYQNTLTKPPGSLGELESIAISFCGYQGRIKPQLNKVNVRVFAGDHGVCAQGVSAFPQIVTTQMIENFIRGGAAISILSEQMGADFKVLNMGTAHTPISTDGVVDCAIAPGTNDFTQGAAMSEQQCMTAMASGRDSVTDCDLFIGGEMGIGNTTSASALFSALLTLTPEITVGPGTGVDTKTLQHKCTVVCKALEVNHINADDPLEALRCLGGFEIAALTGAYIGAAQKGIPVLVDGFIATAAALIACRLNPSVSDWLIFAHQSAEPAHALVLESLYAKPLLNLGLRLGEGSGAAVAVPLIKSALALHNQMATFDAAGVSDA